MDEVTAAQTSEAANIKDILLLKKSQDLYAGQALALIASLPNPPPPPPPSPPGIGGDVDFYA